jgi:hypothetical protein
VTIDVTGITDAPVIQGGKEVHFSWQYKSMPSVVKRFIVEGGTGVANLKKYDDGWRVENVDINFSKNSAALDSQEVKQEQQDAAIIEEARRNRLEKERQETERLQKVLQKSKTRTRNFGQLELSWPSTVGGEISGTSYATIVISDVDIVVQKVDRGISGSFSQTEIYWFGDIINIRKAYDNRMGLNGIVISTRTNFGESQHLLWSKDKSKTDNLYNVISQVVTDWRGNNSEVVQKNIH